jgi:exodeoxyribonuclease III
VSIWPALWPAGRGAKTWAMKIATWNCNSIRARQERLVQWLDSASPDVLCLQELKCVDGEFPAAAIAAAGYRAVCYGQKGYNGVAILSRAEPSDVVRGLADGEDGQSRLVAATVEGIRVICAYAPNGQEVGSPAYQFKLSWYARLEAYLRRRHRPDEPLVLCGDFNVAPEPLDVYEPSAWEGQTLFTLPEREALAKVVGFGLLDTFRKHHPEGDQYSWWDYRMLSFPKNRGLRIDHLYATAPLAARCVAAEIDREARKGKQPSDHAPVWARFER